MASGSESAKEEHYHNLTSKQREQILGKINFNHSKYNLWCLVFEKSPVFEALEHFVFLVAPE